MKSKYVQIYENKKIKNYLRKKKFNAGDILYVVFEHKHELITLPIQGSFLGICLGVFKSSLTTTMRLRNVLNGEGIEFQCYSLAPSILSLNQVNMVKGKYVRRKLHYLRKRVLWESTILYKTFLKT